MSPENKALELIPSIYRVSIDDSSITTCLGSIMSELRAPFGWALQTPGMGKQVAGGMAGVDSNFTPKWVDEYYEVDPAMAAAHRIKPGHLVSLDELLSYDEHRSYRNSDFFHGWIKHSGIEGSHFCFFNFRDMWPESSFFASRYLDGNHLLAGREVQLIDLLVPHIKAATNTWRRLRAERKQADQSIDALDLLPSGVVLVDASESVLHANKAARAMFDQVDGLYVKKDKLCLAAYDASRRLSKLINACTSTACGASLDAGGAVAAPRASGRRPYEIFVSPLFGERHSDAIEIPAAAIVFISDPEQRISPPSEILHTLYQLTPSEARLAIELANDRSLANAAERLFLTVGSARVMLKRIFDKTGTHRQASLVRLLNHGPLTIFASKSNQLSD